jgi:hypothetical protein
MLDFQLVEGHMRKGIEIRQRQLADLVRLNATFRYVPDLKWLENLTMGKLADEFTQYCGDVALMKRIKESVPIRNMFAHNLMNGQDVEVLTRQHYIGVHQLRSDLQDLMDREFYRGT